MDRLLFLLVVSFFMAGLPLDARGLDSGAAPRLPWLESGADASTDAPYVAYSLREAQRRLQEPGGSTEELTNLAGITRIAGMVYDHDSGDLILVGQMDRRWEQITLDDFVVAVRALLVHGAWPLVSIDKTAETRVTGKQRVRLEGGIANTRFAWNLLEADVVLKKLALEFLPTDARGFKSYFALSADRARQKGLEGTISTRFWFYPMNPSLAVRDGVFAIEELQVGVRAEVVSVEGEATSSEARDEPAEHFTAGLSEHYEDLAVRHPEIARLKTLFDLVALAKGIQSLPSRPDMGYWLRDYQVATVETPSDYPLLKQEKVVETAGGTRRLEIDGGVELKAIMLRLQDGDVTALRDAVLRSKPAGMPLTWGVPLRGWRISGSRVAVEDSAAGETPGYAVDQELGTTLTIRLGAESSRPSSSPSSSSVGSLYGLSSSFSNSSFGSSGESSARHSVLTSSSYSSHSGSVSSYSPSMSHSSLRPSLSSLVSSLTSSFSSQGKPNGSSIPTFGSLSSSFNSQHNSSLASPTRTYSPPRPAPGPPSSSFNSRLGSSLGSTTPRLGSPGSSFSSPGSFSGSRFGR